MSETKRVNILNPQRMGLAEQMRQDWIVNAEEGTIPSDVMEPSYWSHMSAQMQPYDRIDVRLETGQWLMELIVLGVGRNWAHVHLVAKHDLQPVEDSMPSAIKHKVKWRGAQHKHCVVRISDNEVLQTGFDTAGAAQAWLNNYETVTA